MPPTVSMATIDTAHNDDSNSNILCHDTLPATLPANLQYLLGIQLHCLLWYSYPKQTWPGAHLTNDFSIVIQIWWKIGFTVTSLQGAISLQNFVHTMNTQLLCHVRNFIVITPLHLWWKHNEISIKFEFGWKNHSWNWSQNFISEDPLQHGSPKYTQKM